MATAKSAEKTSGFEKSLERLETIVREMEGGELSLEKMMKYFEEGMELAGSCAQKLNEVERKIEMLVKKGENPVLTPLRLEEDEPIPKESGRESEQV